MAFSSVLRAMRPLPFVAASSACYKIVEMAVPAPYYLPDKDADREQTVSLNAGEEKTLTFKNRKAPQLTIYKEDSVAGAPIDRAFFFSDAPYKEVIP